MDRWTQYLYEQHSETELRDWVTTLHMFRYFRAYGGHANDGDSLDAAFKYGTTEELIKLLQNLGISPVIFAEKPDQPVKDKPYDAYTFASFPSLIQDTEWIKQPGHCEIFGIKVFIWCGNGLVTVSTNPGSYVVTSEHIKAAQILEQKLAHLRPLLVDPPVDTKHYVCPKYHPDLFQKMD